MKQAGEREGVEARSRRLARLGPQQLAEAYRRAWEACRMHGNQVPRAEAMEELVVTWRLLCAWEDRRAQVFLKVS